MSPTLPYYQYTIAGLALAVMSAELDNAILHAFKTKNLGQIMKRRSNQVVTESGSFFVKTAKDSDEQASKMLEAEYASLQSIHEAAPSLAPRPLDLGRLSSGDGLYFISDYVKLGSLRNSDQAKLGKRIAEMHRHNVGLKQPVKQFGYHRKTYCGNAVLENDWQNSWAQFYADQRIRSICNRISTAQGDQVITDLGDKVASKVVPLLCSSEKIKPALLHGDLWSGNASVNSETGEPVLYDACSFYGHNEAELGIMRMCVPDLFFLRVLVESLIRFGGFTRTCFDAYHEVIPKLEPFYEERLQLYELYHQLNHAFLFGGGGYRSTAVSMMKRLLSFAEGQGSAN